MIFRTAAEKLSSHDLQLSVSFSSVTSTVPFGTSIGRSLAETSSTKLASLSHTRLTTMPATPEPAPAPTRNERKACWSHRDSYFSCLTQKGVVVPPGTDMSDGRGPIGKAAKEEQEKLEKEKKQTVEEARKQDPCLSERQGYETNCARSWVSEAVKQLSVGKIR